jgi:hypothetical protein
LEERALLAVSSFTDQAAFLAVLPGTAQTVDFDSVAGGTPIADGAALGGMTFNYNLGGVSLQVVNLPTTSPPHALKAQSPGGNAQTKIPCPIGLTDAGVVRENPQGPNSQAHLHRRDRT